MASVLFPENSLPIPDLTKSALDMRYSADSAPFQIDVHTHPFYEIHYFLEGPLESYMIGGRRYRLCPGDILVIPPETIHYPLFQSGVQKPYRRYILWLSQEQIRQFEEVDAGLVSLLYRAREQSEYRIRSLVPPMRRQLEEYLSDMWREVCSASSCKQAYLYGLCLHFLATLTRAVTEQQNLHTSRPGSDALLDLVLAYVHQHHTTPISLKQVADFFFISPSSVESLFTRQLQRPFYRYVTECRIYHAQQLIASGIPLKEVGAACGYNDYSNFYRAFLNITGVSPSRFRQQLKPDRNHPEH